MSIRGESVHALAGLVDGELRGDPELRVTDVTHDSRQAGPGSMFIAIEGQRFDGHDFILSAVRNGASAICVQQPASGEVAQLIVPDTRAVMGRLASAVHGDPSGQLQVVGVTGTNGKTTVTHYLESILNRAGRTTGLIGTVTTRVGAMTFPTVRTTPEATDFQRLLAWMRDQGASAVAAEVSSHALQLSRVAATRFAVAAFTNLSQDHLDFHGSMAEYRRAKERLFSEYPIGAAVINVDDPAGAEIAGWVDAPLISVGAGGEVGAANVEVDPMGSQFDLRFLGETIRVSSPVLGEFNIQNVTMAAGCAAALGLGRDEVVEGIRSLPVVPGRFEAVSPGGEVRVIVDYAHTPEGISSAIAAARRLGAGRVIVVVGAGGDRDKEKRPLMGAAASSADVTILTSDNPRSEDPLEIIEQVSSGASGTVLMEADRKKAIRQAIDLARASDVVLVLGKGHETGQEVGDTLLPFDDREVVGLLLEERETRGSPGDSRSMLA